MTNKEIVEWYKTITNELGIDLITLFMALKEGIYVKELKTVEYYKPTLICLGFHKDLVELALYKPDTFPEGYECVRLEKYGTDWVLTKEELEK